MVNIMPHSAKKIGFQFFSQAETLWHMRGAMNNSVYAAAGGNVVVLKSKTAQIGDVVRHCTGRAANVGRNDQGQHLYGVVIDSNTEQEEVLVKFLGEVSVRCSGQAVPGYLACVGTGGMVDCAPEKDCTTPARIIGVVASKDSMGRCRVVLGQGRKCARCSPFSARFMSEQPTNNVSAMAAASVSLPNGYVHGVFKSGIERAEVRQDGSLYVTPLPDMFKKPPMAYASIISDDDLRVCAFAQSVEEIVVSFYRGITKVSASTLGKVVNIILVGEV